MKATILPDNKILAFSKLKAFADDNFNMTQLMQFLLKPLPDDKF